MGGLYVPAGEFLMGSTDADIAQAQKDCLNQLVAAGSGCDFNNEKPQHKVYLDAFWIDRTEVTNAMFAEFTAEKGYKTDAERLGGGYVFHPSANLWEQTSGADWQHPRGRSTNLKGLDAHPVVQVSWNDAKAYCEWAGRQLPTEAQWEKAARGMDRRQYPWGNDPVAGNLLNFADKNLNVGWADKAIDDGYQFTSPVGYYPAGASPYGALDMAGNVCEWVADWYDKNYYANSPDRNPAGPTSGQSRVLRSASWRIGAPSVRAANRGSVTPASRGDLLGFRCIRSTSP
jgi:formylglycine-generating enzyme required for sulfatase activity